MFKRLSKSKRHSVEGTLTGVATPPSPSGESLLSLSLSLPLTESSDLPNIRGARASRAKQARRSCGDQPISRVMQPLDNYSDHEHEAEVEADHQAGRIARVNAETDYQMVTAVPAYIVEHEPEKQRGLGVWGRRMSKKIDSFRRSGCRDALLPAEPTPEKSKIQGVDPRRFSTPQRSASPFKSFFIRMGSTGMLNSSKSNRRSLQSVGDDETDTGNTTTVHRAGFRSSRSPERDQTPLFRSCSTSQLNTTPTYVKGDDPSEGIDLRISGKESKTVSCDNLAGQLIDDVFEPVEVPLTPRSDFQPCDFGDGRRGELQLVRKSVSCDFRESRDSRDSKSEAIKKTNFPYAFLRSKLSVLPEERHAAASVGTALTLHSVAKHQSPEERLFKTVSEEHFPSLLRVDDGTETTTLGRRRSRPNGGSASYFRIGGRNSYSEYRSPSYDLERHVSPMSLGGGQDRVDLASSVADYADLEPVAQVSSTTATLRSQRRNSAPSAEQRLSSHYVSSNESGYDSDGPRGESAAASEAEALSLNRADSSDTSSVMDSEIEKPTRSSTPSEYTENPEGIHVHVHHHHHHQGGRTSRNSRDEEAAENGLEGLRWHQTTSGRILPSINQISTVEMSQNGVQDARENVLGTNLSSPHRVRLQQDKTRFLSDIIQPAERVRRCRLVNLTKTDPAESLGIRLAQQMSERLHYVVVELEHKGIAHRDGRLRLGDEIVEVEGRDLATLESLHAVQEFLASFRGHKVQLLTAYEESVPQVCAVPGETEYFENAKTLSNISLSCDAEIGRSVAVTMEKTQVATQPMKRPDYLPLNGANMNPGEILLDPHRCLTRHVARFEKGYGKPSLGFSVVGGRDSPRGEMGIFVRRVFPGGQADVSKSLIQGDEITTLNGKILRGCTHREVIELFKAVREGPVELEIARRHRYPKSAAEAATTY